MIEINTAAYDKTLYLEGALWIIDKILRELEVKEGDVKDFAHTFRQKIEGNLSQ